MQCYGYEVLCRTLVALVKQQYPSVEFDTRDAADLIDDHGIDSISQKSELIAIARDVGMHVQRAA